MFGKLSCLGFWDSPDGSCRRQLAHTISASIVTHAIHVSPRTCHTNRCGSAAHAVCLTAISHVVAAASCSKNCSGIQPFHTQLRAMYVYSDCRAGRCVYIQLTSLPLREHHCQDFFRLGMLCYVARGARMMQFGIAPPIAASAPPARRAYIHKLALISRAMSSLTREKRGREIYMRNQPSVGKNCPADSRHIPAAPSVGLALHAAV